MPTIAEYLKYANLQMAAEAFIRNERTGELASSGQQLIDALMEGKALSVKDFDRDSLRYKDDASGISVSVINTFVSTDPTKTPDVHFGSDQADTLTGTDNKDHLYGGLGSDTLSGGKGDDYLEGNAGTDVCPSVFLSSVIFIRNKFRSPYLKKHRPAPIISTRRYRVLTALEPPGAKPAFFYSVNRIDQGVRYMKIRPLHDRVIVKRLEEERKTASGIVIPDTAAEKPDQGEVLAVGPGKRDDSGKQNALDVKVGDRVLFGKYAGQSVKVDGQELLVMREEDIMGVVEA